MGPLSTCMFVESFWKLSGSNRNQNHTLLQINNNMEKRTTSKIYVELEKTEFPGNKKNIKLRMWNTS